MLPVENGEDNSLGARACAATPVGETDNEATTSVPLTSLFTRERGWRRL
jgi:hypothetical protein